MNYSARKALVMGVDLVSYGGKGRTPRYAMVLLKDGEVLLENSDVSLHRLIRLLWEYKPNILAVDNVFELGGSERKLVKFFNMLPPTVKVIQVTRWQDEFIDVKEAAMRAGIGYIQGKPTPLKTAYMVALIASRGYGVEVKLYEEKTKIIVSRTASIGPGGMSQNRYKRRLRGIVLSLTRKIKEALDKHGLDYDLTFRKSGGGLESSVFTVYAPREKLYGIVKPLRTSDVRVEIRPIYKPKISFLNREESNTVQRYLIVGVDPGISTGLAILDIDGVPLEIISGRGLDRVDIVNRILSYGIPIVIATDVNPAPDAVKKLASMFNAVLYVPPQSLSSDEKRQLVEEYVSRYHWLRVEDSHQRDALAAAIRAYHNVESKLRQVGSYLSKIGLEVSIDNIKAAVIKGKSIAEAVEEEIAKLYEETEELEEKPRPPEKQEKPEYSIVEERLREELKEVKQEKEHLRERVKELEKRIRELEFELKYVKATRNPEEEAARTIEMLKNEVKRLTEYAKSLEKELNKLRNDIALYKKYFIQILRGEVIPARRLHMLTSDALVKSEKILGEIKKGEILYVENPGYFELDAIEKLAKVKVKAVLLDDIEGKGLIDALKKNLIPVLRLNEYLVGELFDVILVRTDVVLDADKIRKELEEERRKLEKSQLLEILKEYRSSRKAELGF